MVNIKISKSDLEKVQYLYNNEFQIYNNFNNVMLYMNVGVKHFIEPEWFLQIMPPNFPHHYEAVYWSGFELLLDFYL